MTTWQYFVYHPGGKEWFREDELKQANLFAQRLANETSRPITRYDIDGGKSIFYPQF
jgi:hypothetical protein